MTVKELLEQLSRYQGSLKVTIIEDGQTKQIDRVEHEYDKVFLKVERND